VWAPRLRVRDERIVAKETREVATWSDGVPRFTAYTTAHRAPWLVSVGLPTAVASTRIATQLESSGLFSISAIAIASVIAWIVSGRIIRPMRQLERDAAVLASGELGHRTSVASASEFGKLGEAFNLMASSMERRRNANLEHTDELLHTKNTLDAVIDASPVAIVCSDLDRRIFVWNRAAEDMYGYTEAEVLGAPFSFSHSQDLEPAPPPPQIRCGGGLSVRCPRAPW
jgi:PAS domain-containing protein